MSIRLCHDCGTSGVRAVMEANVLVVGSRGPVEASAELPEALNLGQRQDTDVIIVDLDDYPAHDGVEMIRRLHGHGSARIVVLFGADDAEQVHEVWRAGVAACVSKNAPVAEFVRAIQDVMAGSTFSTSSVALEDGAGRATGALMPLLEKLSSREREVLHYIADGESSSDIARILHLSAHTVDTHRRNIMEKLGIHNLAKLIKFALRHGLSSLQ